jgi:spore coat protein U-like protein
MPVTVLRAGLVIGIWLCLLAPAQAQSCSFGFTNVAFGNVDVTTGGTHDTTGTFSANCTGAPLATIRICPHIGAGSGGAGANGSPRTMLKDGTGPGGLNYNLYQDASRSTVWGSSVAGWSAGPPQIDLTLNALGSGSVNRTVYGRIAGSQNTAAVGAYSSTLSTAETKVRYAYLSAAACDTIDATNESGQTFSVTAAVEARCTVNATNLNFPSTGLLASAQDATNTVSVVCTQGAPYQIGLGAGLNHAGLGTSARKMKAGAETITYQLYRDAGRSLVWGDTLDTDTKGGTGIGITDNHTVYGRVPAQTTPSPGTYSDTIVVTVTY